MSETSQADLLASIILYKQLSSRVSHNSARRFLRHAATTVPFYKRWFKGWKTPNLRDFPLISRADIASDPFDFTSDHFPRTSLIENTTSGSSGMPLRINRDPISYYSFFYYSYRHIFNTIDVLPDIDQLVPAECSVWSINDNPRNNQSLVINPSLNYSFMRRVIVEEGVINDKKLTCYFERPFLITGRPRAILSLANILGTAAKSLHTRAVVCSGDNLARQERSAISSAFLAPVYNAYVTQEAGLVAFETKPDSFLQIVSEVTVEAHPLAEPCAMPSRDSELVVTSADNWAMPIVRYRTGDIGRLTGDSSSKFIDRIDGRTSVFLRTNESRINPSVFNDTLELAWISQYQVRQAVDMSIHIYLVCEMNTPRLYVRQHVTNAFASFFPLNAICVYFVDRIHVAGKKPQRYVQDGAASSGSIQ